MKSVIEILGMVLVLIVIAPLSSTGRQQRCLRYNAYATPFAKLEGDWYVQDYANAGSAFDNQTCIKLSISVGKRGNVATLNKTWVDKWSKRTEYKVFFIKQIDPVGILFLNKNNPSWKIISRILQLTDDGIFIHSSCELIGPRIQTQRITTATRKHQVDRNDWLKAYNQLGRNVFQNHFEVQQNNCLY